MRVFGKASDFYRLRVLKVNEDSGLELDWQSDILYRAAPAAEIKTDTWYAVQVVSVDSEAAFELKRFTDGEAALRYKDKLVELLQEVTKSDFEERFSDIDFLTPPPPGVD